jgi:succinate dehydrogenase flavin-adding protein (antitoxin of CptAB toxin-antitoxin module)
MIPFDNLYQQTHDIAELSKVLSVLIEDREICDTKITCDLFMRYSDKVKSHLDLQDTNLYSVLLSHSDKHMNAVGKRFVEGSREINRIFNAYMRRWCPKTTHNLKIFNHEMFVKETKEMFHLIASRTQSEVEELYPAARALESFSVAKSA